MRQIRFTCRGDVYAVGRAAQPVRGFDEVSASEAVHVLRELQHAGQNHALTDILEDSGLSRSFAPVDPVSLQWLIREFSQGLGQLVLFRRPPPKSRPLSNAETQTVDLATLGPAVIRTEVEHWIEVEIVGANRDPVPGFEVEVEVPTGTLRRGQTNLFGFVRMDGMPAAGMCKVFMPELDPSDVPEAPEVPLTTLEFEVVDDDGGPMANLELTLELSDGTSRTIMTDATGNVRLSDVPQGVCTIRQASPTS